MATAVTRKRKSEEPEVGSHHDLEPMDKKSSPSLCSLRSCSKPLTEGDSTVEIVVRSSGCCERLIDWKDGGREGGFHQECWAEVLRSARARTARRLPMSHSEKSSIKEAAKTAEYHDGVDEIREKAERIARLIRESKRVIAFTGAGISTSAGIGDYRGKKGKWTELDRHGDDGDGDDEGAVPYEELRPTYTHESLAKLVEMGLIKHVITQNCDGLHELSGVTRDKMSCLHGNVFVEKCEYCGQQYNRPYYVLDDECSQYYEDIEERGRSDIRKPAHAIKCQSCGLSHRTGRRCEACSGHLNDIIINFGDDLNRYIFRKAVDEAVVADLCLSLGSTMTVTPASDLISLGNKKLVIVNRQKTEFDSSCKREGGVRVFGDCDILMERVMELLLKKEEKKDWDENKDKRLKIYDNIRNINN